MQNKSPIYCVFQNIGQFLCPKKPFSLIFIDIKVSIEKVDKIKELKKRIREAKKSAGAT